MHTRPRMGCARRARTHVASHVAARTQGPRLGATAVTAPSHKHPAINRAAASSRPLTRNAAITPLRRPETYAVPQPSRRTHLPLSARPCRDPDTLRLGPEAAVPACPSWSCADSGGGSRRDGPGGCGLNVRTHRLSGRPPWSRRAPAPLSRPCRSEPSATCRPFLRRPLCGRSRPLWRRSAPVNGGPATRGSLGHVAPRQQVRGPWGSPTPATGWPSASGSRWSLSARARCSSSRRSSERHWRRCRRP